MRSYGLAGAVDAGAVDAGVDAGIEGNGVRMTGDKADDVRPRVSPKLGHRSNLAVTFKNTLAPLTLPRSNRSVPVAPRPLLMNR